LTFYTILSIFHDAFVYFCFYVHVDLYASADGWANKLRTIQIKRLQHCVFW